MAYQPVPPTLPPDLAAKLRGRTIAITGSTGFVGSALVHALESHGCSVRRFVRRKTDLTRYPGAIVWNSSADRLELSTLDGVDGLVNLAGKSLLAGRWNPALKEDLHTSRIPGTRLLALAVAERKDSGQRTPVFISASAEGYYGDSGDTPVDESAPVGSTYLARLAADWEAATRPATLSGARVVNLRIGAVMDPAGGALKTALLPFRLGLGGPVGSGRQVMSWVSRADLVGIILRALVDERLKGPVNAVAPTPVTNAEFGKALGRALHRPACLPTPAFAIRLAMGEVADATVLHSARVVPARLQAVGHQFKHPDLDTAFKDMLG